MPVPASLASYDGVACDVILGRSGATSLLVVDRCRSTMDLCHALAADGAPHGSVVVAGAQAAGRGRSGKAWVSGEAAGVWASVLLRRSDGAPPGVLPLRVGIALADGLERLADVRIGLKWPNDLFAGGGKLAGVLTEARWRGDSLEWMVVGVGVNVTAPTPHGDGLVTASLGPQVTRADVLVAVVRAVLGAAARDGALDAAELATYAARDVATGRRVSSPLAGVVAGITPSGGLRVHDGAGESVAVAGSLVFVDNTEG
ncbi:MAG: biotin--[acetyl-CoA-carboxylase] ligase [Gemmatimonadaceae bacterium]|nr:biotin--[acetyl-CoA-carboxylase] ligase [Gemmatimonadaceae bacterium]